MSDINYMVGETKHSIPSSGTQAQAVGIQQLMDRIEKEKQKLSTQEITIDGSNEVSFPSFPYKFEALGEKILVSIDIFKSGYECKKCKGKKEIETKCSCETSGHAGLRYGTEEIQAIKESLGSNIADERANLACTDCKGDYISQRRIDKCDACKGLGALLHLPDDSKNLPTTGVVVSIGSKCNLKELNYKHGDRVLFGPYAGSLIPTKAGLMFKIMDASQAWCKIKGGDDLAAFDFIIQDKEAF